MQETLALIMIGAIAPGLFSAWRRGQVHCSFLSRVQ